MTCVVGVLSFSCLLYSPSSLFYTSLFDLIWHCCGGEAESKMAQPHLSRLHFSFWRYVELAGREHALDTCLALWRDKGDGTLRHSRDEMVYLFLCIFFGAWPLQLLHHLQFARLRLQRKARSVILSDVDLDHDRALS